MKSGGSSDCTSSRRKNKGDRGNIPIGKATEHRKVKFRAIITKMAQFGPCIMYAGE
jgi:hypothetical protein